MECDGVHSEGSAGVTREESEERGDRNDSDDVGQWFTCALHRSRRQGPHGTVRDVRFLSRQLRLDGEERPPKHRGSQSPAQQCLPQLLTAGVQARQPTVHAAPPREP